MATLFSTLEGSNNLLCTPLKPPFDIPLVDDQLHVQNTHGVNHKRSHQPGERFDTSLALEFIQFRSLDGANSYPTNSIEASFDLLTGQRVQTQSSDGSTLTLARSRGGNLTSQPLEFRSFDGSGNNLANTAWGTPGTAFLRLTTSAYEDRYSAPRGGFNPSSLPNPRDISRKVLTQTDTAGNHIDILNQRGVSDWFWQWGQFLDHDLDLTRTSSEAGSLNIPLAADDPLVIRGASGAIQTQFIPFTRSAIAPGTGTDNPREQFNSITAYIDGSMIYGSDSLTASNLRGSNGQLRTSIAANGEVLLPTNVGNSFVAGDTRVNEQMGLTAVQTLFLREHNRVALSIWNRLDDPSRHTLSLRKLFQHSGLTKDEFTYQAARKVVGAEIQAITYNEFLPLLLGGNGVGAYHGYNPNVNPGISNEFATAAYRLGHSMLSPQLLRVTQDASGATTTTKIALRDAFFKADLVRTDGVDSLLLGLSQQRAQELDGKIVTDVQNFLFRRAGDGGLDLGSLNIQRGRDHGIASYGQVRQDLLGHNGVGVFAREDRDRLLNAYGNLQNMDLWVAGLSEKDVRGGMVGETFHHILRDQFTRLRDGDRFFYLRERNTIEILSPGATSTTLTDVVRSNYTGNLASAIPNNVFLV